MQSGRRAGAHGEVSAVAAAGLPPNTATVKPSTVTSGAKPNSAGAEIEAAAMRAIPRVTVAYQKNAVRGLRKASTESRSPP